MLRSLFSYKRQAVSAYKFSNATPKDPLDFGDHAETRYTTPEQYKLITNGLLTKCQSNLHFIDNTLRLLFSTTTVLGSNPLRALRRSNLQFIQQTNQMLLLRRSRPTLVPFADLTTAFMKPLMLVGTSQIYIGGRCLQAVQSQIDDYLRQLNDYNIEDQQLRLHIRNIRDTYNSYSQGMVAQEHCKLLELKFQNIYKNILDKIMKTN